MHYVIIVRAMNTARLNRGISYAKYIEKGSCASLTSFTVSLGVSFWAGMPPSRAAFDHQLVIYRDQEGLKICGL